MADTSETVETPTTQPVQPHKKPGPPPGYKAKPKVEVAPSPVEAVVEEQVAPAEVVADAPAPVVEEAVAPIEVPTPVEEEEVPPVVATPVVMAKVHELRLWHHHGAEPLPHDHPVLQSWLQRFRNGQFLGLPIGHVYEDVVLGHICECHVFSNAIAAFNKAKHKVTWLGSHGEIE